MSPEPEVGAAVSFLNGTSIVHGWWAGPSAAQVGRALLTVGALRARETFTARIVLSYEHLTPPTGRGSSVR